MSFERIHLLVGVQDRLLLVFYSDAHAWQFRIINDNAVFGERKLYYSAEDAEKVGREWLKTES